MPYRAAKFRNNHIPRPQIYKGIPRIKFRYTNGRLKQPFGGKVPDSFALLPKCGRLVVLQLANAAEYQKINAGFAALQVITVQY